MRTVFSFIALLLLLGSCKQEKAIVNADKKDLSDQGTTLVAKDIIYDVLVQAEIDDPWEHEKVAGYKGETMINKLFADIYEGRFKVTDYFSGEVLSANGLKKMENMPEFSRDRIGKIQFTEDWYYNDSTMQVDKIIRSMVPGYRKDPDDLGRIGYLAGFKIEF